MASEANESFTFDEELDDILYMIEEGFLDEDDNFIKEIEGIECSVICKTSKALEKDTSYCFCL